MPGLNWVRSLFRGRKAHASQRARQPAVQLRVQSLEDRLVPAPLVVSSAADHGAGTLRSAIAMANRMAGPVTIDFAIGASGSSQVIRLTSALPAIAHTVFIDGASQGGSGYSGPPLIELNGARAGTSSSGLVLDGHGCTIEGLSVEFFAQDGILLRNHATANTIGGAAAGAANIISGNGNDGVEIVGAGVIDNLVEGNFIGVNSNSIPVPNRFDGVVIRTGASHNTIGGTLGRAGNVISGNGNDGIEIINVGTVNNVVQGNFIGTSADGAAAVANRFDGVVIRTGAAGNTIGGTASGAGNLISGNSNDGVEIINSGTAHNLLEGNMVGTDVNGTAIIANRFDGVVIRTGAAGNTIGGAVSGAANIIAGNGNDGIEMINSGTVNNEVLGNFIGANSNGGAVANKFDGVVIRAGAARNTVGGTTAGAGNVISGNGNDGIEIINSGTASNLIQGNFIGTNANGTVSVANQFDGLVIRTGASQNTIGGTTSGAGNVISGNGNDGIEIVDATRNLIQGNMIGAQLNGTSRLGNGANGIAVRDLAAQNTIGGTVTGAGNIIAFNAGNGVLIGDTRAGIVAGSGNAVEGNSIFANRLLGIFLGFDDTSRPPVVLLNDSQGHPPVNNSYQDYPVLNTPQVTANSTILTGTLSSPNNPNSTFRIEFFSNGSADPSGHGPGQNFLGAVTVTTNANGQASFTLTLNSTLPSGDIISATATDALGDTSEFSSDVTVP